jgi:hypothetical protein
MEPARKKVEFVPVEDGRVVLVIGSTAVTVFLFELGGELFAEYGDHLIALLKDGFTSYDGVRWEHFPNSPINIRANALGRIVICQS